MGNINSPNNTNHNNNNITQTNYYKLSGFKFINRVILSQQQDRQFACLKNKPVTSGSSPSRQFMLHLPTATEWVCKCSLVAILSKNQDYTLNTQNPTDSINEYKQLLSLRLYSLFGVQTPPAVLSRQVISPQAQKMFAQDLKSQLAQFPKLKKQLDINVPRIHIMSCFIESFKPLGGSFIKKYTKFHGSQRYCVENNVPLIGFGRALAIATFLYDFDCIGNSGNNMGYIIQNGKGLIIKIDAGEALPYVDNMTDCLGINHDPQSRDMITGTVRTTDDTIISFSQLKENDRKEFIEATKDILAAKDETLQLLFQDFICLDVRFQTVLQKLLQRKANFLKAFSPEVSAFLQERLVQIENSTALRLLNNWDSSAYIVGERREIVEEEALLNAYQLQPKNRNFQVPKFNKQFIGRSKELAEMKSMLVKEGIICICGAGGLGKSELAKQYLSQSNYATKIWLHAEHRFAFSQIKAYMNALYPTSKLIKLAEDLVSYFYFRVGSNACIVFDNIENEEELKSVIRQNHQAHVIITSRYKLWHIPTIQLGSFSVSDVRQYASNQKIFVTNSEAESLSQLLEGLPLAVSQAFAYLKQNSSVSVAEYCESSKKNRELILAPAIHNNEKDSLMSSSLFTTIILTLNSTKVRDPLADEVMNIVAFLSADHITQEVLESCSRKKLKQAIEVLVSYSIFYRENRTIKVHRLTQSVSLMVQQKNNVFEKNLKRVMAWIGPLLIYDRKKGDKQDVERVSALTPHALAICEIGKMLDNKADIMRMYLSIGKNQLAKDENALYALQQCLSYAKQYWPANDIKMGHLLTKLSDAYHYVGEYQKKKAASEAALKIFMSNPGQNSQYTLLALYQIGNANLCMKKIKQARIFYERYMALGLKINGQQHITTMSVLKELARVYKLLGNVQAHKLALERVAACFAKYFGQEHYQTLSVIYEITKKKQIQEMVLKKKRQSLHPEDMSIANTLRSLGLHYRNEKKYEKSREYFQESLNIIQKRRGVDSPDVTDLLKQIGYLQLDLGNYKKCKEILQTVMKIQLRFHQPYSIALTDTYFLSSNYHFLVKDFKKSAQFQEKLLMVFKNFPSVDFKREKTALNNLGKLYRRNSKYSMSVYAYKRILKLCPTDYLNRIKAFAQIGNNYELMGNCYAKKVFYLRALKQSIKSVGPDHELTGNVFYDLSYVEAQLSNLPQALNFALKAYNIFVNLSSQTGLAPSYQNPAAKLIEQIRLKLEKQASSKKKKMKRCLCFKDFKDLRKGSKKQIYKIMRGSVSKWSELNDEARLVVLSRKTELTNESQQPFLQVEFRSYIYRLERSQIKDKIDESSSGNSKRTWDSLSDDNRKDLISSFKNRRKEKLMTTLDFAVF